MNYTQREKLIDKLCGTGLMLIGFEVFYAIINSCYTEFNYILSNVTRGVYIAGGVVLAIAIVILVYAYIKKSGTKACYGLELLVLAITAATLPGCYLEYTFPFNKLHKIYPLLFLIYYIGKAIYILIDANKVNNQGKKKKKSNKKKR